MAVAIARALGIGNVIAVDVSDDRLAAVHDLGANMVINTVASDRPVNLRAAAEDALYGIIDTVGQPSTINHAIESVMKGSKIVLVGMQGGRIPLPVPTLPFMALSLLESYTRSQGELEELVEIAKSGALKPMPIWKRDMQCLCDSLDRLRKRQVVGRIALSPS